MNVYVRELAASLAHCGVDVHVYVRRWHKDLPDEVIVEPGVRVVHIKAGDPSLQKEALYDVVDEYNEGVIADIEAIGGVDVLHANYWLSGVAGHHIKHHLNLPLVTTFHTLARVKAETGDFEPERRAKAETKVIACSDVVTASGAAEQHWLERLYDTDPGRIAIVTPGVVHAFFSPGDQKGARSAVNFGDEPMMLFVGRIQPLKGVTVAVEALAAVENKATKLVIVGGPSGEEGAAEMERIHELIRIHDLADRVRFEAPVPHHLLSTWYRAADVVVVPSRSESFGLVALEAAACGTPVIAAAVGGLRTIVAHGRSGYLVEKRDPHIYASYVDQLLGNRMVAAEMAFAAAERAREFSWTQTAQALLQVYDAFFERAVVDCR